MRILVFCQRYWPEQFQVTDICEGLASRGHEVTVVCGLPNVAVPEGRQGRVMTSYRRGANRLQTRNGVRIVRAFEVGRRTGIVWRVANYYSYWKTALAAAERADGEYDVVFSYQLSPGMMAVPASEYAKKHGLPFYLYCCDLWPESLKATLGDRFPAVIEHYGRICRSAYLAADRIGVQSPSFEDYLVNYHGVDGDRVSFYPHFSTDGCISVPVEPHEGFNVVFMGNMGRVQGIQTMLDAMELLPTESGVTLHFVGDGVLLSEAKDRVASGDLRGRVVFHGRQPVERLKQYYSIADACILSLEGETLIGGTIPSKLQGYMSAGRAVIAAVSGGARWVVEESGCGIAVDPGDIAATAEAILTLANDQCLRVEMGERGRIYAEAHFTKAVYLDSLEKQLSCIVKEG